MLAAVVLVAGLGACSSGSSSSSSSSSGSSAAASTGDVDAFCDQARTIVASLGGNVFTDPRGVQRIADRIDALTPPAAIAAQWPAFLDYVHQVATISPRDPDVASKALDVLGESSADVTAVGTYLVETCKIDAAASDLSDFSDVSPRG
jgi:hypothetical protein